MEISSLTVFLHLNYIDMFFKKHSNHFLLTQCNLMKWGYVLWASSIGIAFQHLKEIKEDNDLWDGALEHGMT